MGATVLELKPDRLLLDPNFDGYRLSLEEIPTSRKELETPVKTNLLDSSQYGFLHAKLFCLHNHLFSDRYDDCKSVYFVDKNHNVQKTYVDSFSNELVTPVSVFTIPTFRDPYPGDYNVTLHFSNATYAVLSDGRGLLHILATRDKKDDDFFEIMFSSKVIDNTDKGFIISDSLYHEGRQELHVLLLSIQEDPIYRFVSVIHWLTFKQMYEENSWVQSASRRLKTKGEVQYLYLEQNCDNIYVVSENEVKFETNSLNPIQHETDEGRQIVYTWSQSIDDITIKFKLPEEAEKELVIVSTESTHINVQYQTEMLLTGELFRAIDSNLTVWTLTNNVLEVVLTKKECTYWSELVEEDKRGEYVSDCCTMETVTSNKEASPETGTTFNSQQLEECDYDQDKSEIFQRLSGTLNTITHKIFLGSHQIIVSPHIALDQSPVLGIRQDVDVCLWQPGFENGDFTIKHQGTLLAFGYVQASKQNRKFITCSPNLEYAVISESSGHIFIYHQNKPVASTELRHRASGRRIGNVAQQKVFNLPNQDILGLFANDNHLFVLGQSFILSLNLGAHQE